MRHYYLIVDTETTQRGTVADFGAVIVTKQGEIVEQFGAMVHGHFGKLPLFSDPTADPDAFWSEQSAYRGAQKTMTLCSKAESVQSQALHLLINGLQVSRRATIQP